LSETNFTVAELVKELQQLPQDLPVVVTGYENGYEDILAPHIQTVTDDPDRPYYDGRFQCDDTSTYKVVALERIIRKY